MLLKLMELDCKRKFEKANSFSKKRELVKILQMIRDKETHFIGYGFERFVTAISNPILRESEYLSYRRRVTLTPNKNYNISVLPFKIVQLATEKYGHKIKN
jgi:hypothetical protein